MSSPNLKPCVIPRLERGSSSNRRHCEGAKRPKQFLRILEFPKKYPAPPTSGCEAKNANKAREF